MESRSPPTTHSTTRLHPIDVLLFLRALGLARQAQSVKSSPITEVVERVSRGSGGALDFPVQRLELASTRAVSRWRRWFKGVDSCLTRSLVLGAMLAGRGDVSLNVGFRPGEQESLIDGHAWVTMDGKPIGNDGRLSRERYTRVIEVPFTADSGEG